MNNIAKIREKLERGALCFGTHCSTTDADFIIVMNHGKIAEMGTSEQLLQNKGYYYDVYKLQYGDPEKIRKGVIE